MAGQVLLSIHGAQARVTLSHPGRLGAMTRAMWRELRAVFERLQADPSVRAIEVRGEDGAFCAGGDISEYPDFRFDPVSLRAFHEDDVWGGLGAMLACDVPMVARIQGACMGAGVEIASCCDLRIAAQGSRFGAPIAKLGFPMAPREAALVARVAGEASAREMLLEAAVLDAAEMKSRGFLHAVVPPADLDAQVQTRLDRIAALAPQAARLNKQTLRNLMSNGAVVGAPSHFVATQTIANTSAGDEPDPYAYAPSEEHREGIAAFLAKRPARFA